MGAEAGGARGHTRRSRARGAAVAVAMLAGVVATAATSPAPDPLCPTPAAVVSEFYGPQDVDEGVHQWRPGDWFVSGAFEGAVEQVEVDSCVAEHLDEDGRARVAIALELTDDGSGPDLESFLRASLLVDGLGREWLAHDGEVEERPGFSRNDLPVQRALLTFALPADVPDPVVLRLPDLDGRDDPEGTTTDLVISREPPDETPDVEPTDRPDPTLPTGQRRP